MMAPCKRQVKATRHLICGSCSNWVDFIKSGCEKSWAEVQADSFSFECRGCTKMKELEVELEELRLLVVAMVGREQGSCASSSGGGIVADKVGKDTRDARESSPQPGRKLRGNLLVIAVYFRQMDTSTVVYLFALTVADTVSCVCCII